MRVALVHDFLTKIGGAEKVLKVLSEIYPEAPIYTLLDDKKISNSLFGQNKQIYSSSLQKSIFKNHPKFLLPKFPQAIEEFQFTGFDLVISSSNAFAHGVITPPSAKHICYCHSPMRYAWDWYHQYLAENNVDAGIKSIFARTVLHKIRIWDRVAAFRVDSWVANSENIARRISKYYRAKSKVIYPPTNTNSIPFNQNEPEDFYLIVSRLEPYKKIDLAISAFNKLGKNLLIAGIGSDYQRLITKAKSNIKFLGWKSDNMVYDLMGRAKALIFPGEEDFGLTPVESMAAGRPVIAYNKGGVQESIIKDKTGIFFEKPEVDSLINAVEFFESKEFNRDDCRKRSEKFGIENFKINFKKLVTETFNEN